MVEHTIGLASSRAAMNRSNGLLRWWIGLTRERERDKCNRSTCESRLTSTVDCSKEWFDRECEFIALSTLSSCSKSDSIKCVGNFVSWWLWIWDVRRRLCEAGKRPGEGRRGIDGRNCSVWLEWLFSMNISSAREEFIGQQTLLLTGMVRFFSRLTLTGEFLAPFIGEDLLGQRQRTIATVSRNGQINQRSTGWNVRSKIG